MGAKAPAKLKLRRPTYKCGICDRKMLSVQALKTHKYCIHKISEDSEKPSDIAAKVKINKQPDKSASSELNQRQETSSTEDFSPSKTKVSDVRRIEFECPECKRTFASYFSSFRHIKKHHCPKLDGSKSKQSIKIPMPVRIEICVKCNLRIGSDIHVCHETYSSMSSEAILNYTCTGCSQKFLSISLFDLHVAGLHTEDGVESMFFPQMSDFFMWKEHMEALLSIQYLVLGKCSSKQTYHCTFLNTAESTSEGNEPRLCPSSIVVQEFSKGIQVHYYKKHYGHPCPEYTLTEGYKKYSITSLMKHTPEHYKNITNVESDENDLYIQFKTLMESIVVDAAKIKIDSLKILLGKALEMTSILTNYDEDDETISPPNDKTLTDEQISSALEKLRSKKRKIDTPITKEVVKKAKPSNNEVMSPKIVNAFSVAETNEVNKRPETPKSDNSKVIKKLTKIDTPPSFNDSYKDFVDKNFIKPDDNKSKVTTPKTVQTRNTVDVQNTVIHDENKAKVTTARTVQTRNTVALKTYDGPELRRSRSEKEEILKPIPIKPREVTNMSKEVQNKLQELPTKSKEVSIKAKDTTGKPKEVPIKTKEIPNKEKEVPTKTDVPNKIKEVTVKTKAGPAKRKELKSKKKIVKTKIGQFKPSLSPKKPELNKSIDKLKVDFDYEVKEQENDCNILILKI